MSRWIVMAKHSHGVSTLQVYNHINTAIREADELKAKGAKEVHVYEEMRPCTSPDIKQRAREATAALKAERNSQDTSLSGLYSWWHSPQGHCCCEEVR